MQLKFAPAALVTVAAALSASLPAAAADAVPGNNILIKGIARSSSTVSRFGDNAPQSQASQPTEFTSTIKVLNGGRALAWFPLTTPSCPTDEGFTSTAVIYAQGSSKSGRFKCNPHDFSGYGGAQHRMSVTGGYSGKATFTGGVLSLQGQFTYKQVTDRTDPSGAQVDTQDNVVRQNLRLRISDGGCEVISYSEAATMRGVTKGRAAGNPFTSTMDTDTVAQPVGAVTCQII